MHSSKSTPNYFESFLVIDASGKYVLPGGIDVDVHLESPFNEVCVSLTYIYIFIVFSNFIQAGA